MFFDDERTEWLWCVKKQKQFKKLRSFNILIKQSLKQIICRVFFEKWLSNIEKVCSYTKIGKKKFAPSDMNALISFMAFVRQWLKCIIMCY